MVRTGFNLKSRIDADAVNRLDVARSRLEASIEMPRGFVLPGGTHASAHLDLARAIARRCERRVCALQSESYIDNPQMIAWFNRLSDYLWLLARAENDAPEMV